MFSFFFRQPAEKTLEWMGVDIHSHLIPGIDDGVSDAPSSARYIRSLNELGIEKFICTPHVFTEIYPNTPDTIGAAAWELKAELKRQAVDVQVSAAAEYMLDPDFNSILEEGKLLCLGGTYVLVEMSYQVETPKVERYIFDLYIKGYKPVLAHPERYVYYHNNFQQYRRLRDRGCLLQLNLLSLAGYYGKAVRQVALSLLKEGLIDLVATDLHHERHLQHLQEFVKSGSAGRILRGYSFRNKELFM